MEIRPVGAEFIHADRQTDRHDEAKRDDFRDPANAVKNALTL